MSVLKINSINHDNILHDDFNSLTSNNEIEFSRQKIAVIYGPNGTGKTTITKALTCEGKNSFYNVEYNSVNYKNDKSFFHIIMEHKNRNIIKGETKDFILKDNIKKEYELKELLEEKKAAFVESTINLLKDFGITTMGNNLFKLLMKKPYFLVLRDCANRLSKGRNTDYEAIIKAFTSICKKALNQNEINEKKLDFVLKDYPSESSIIKKLKELVNTNIGLNPQIAKIEQHDDAINILEKYHDLDHCIVCDNLNISPNDLAEKKREHRQIIIDLLDEKVKKILHSIQSSFLLNDPFEIKSKIIKMCETGDTNILTKLNSDIDSTIEYFIAKLENSLYDNFHINDITNLYTEYNKLISSQIELTDDDVLYIERIINENIRTELSVKRDNDKNIRIYIGNNQITDEELPLSTGEQNFISLSFELLKAKNNSDCKVVVLDDPISSFDSIYKTKIVFAIIKILDNKDSIILTHNVDLLRLLEAQYKNCYNLYMFYNSHYANNGFIKINKKEKELLLHLNELIAFFRSKVFEYVISYDLFFMSMIPFMRGYSHLLLGNNYTILTGLMHGYKTESVDVKNIYSNLFGHEIDKRYKKSCNLSVSDILKVNIQNNTEIINANKYPLMNQTLIHTLTYLQIRLIVEKTLVKKYNIDTDKSKQLGQIIDVAFPSSDDTTINLRVTLTSKKTLINEFNHFEGNLSIFQPAIDISTQALLEEKNAIIELVEEIEKL